MLLQRLYPERRVGHRVVHPLRDSSGGLVGRLLPIIEDLIDHDLLSVSPVSLVLDAGVERYKSQDVTLRSANSRACSPCST